MDCQRGLILPSLSSASIIRPPREPTGKSQVTAIAMAPKLRGILKGTNSNSSQVHQKQRFFFPPTFQKVEQKFHKIFVPYGSDQAFWNANARPARPQTPEPKTQGAFRAPPKPRVRFTEPERTLVVSIPEKDLESDEYLRDDESIQAAPPSPTDPLNFISSSSVSSAFTSFVPLRPTNIEYPPSPVVPSRSTFKVVPFPSASNLNSESTLEPPFIPPSSMSQNGSSSAIIIPPSSASSAMLAESSGPQRDTPKIQPVDLPSTDYYGVDHHGKDEPESLTHSERSTAPWVLASRKLHLPKKPTDFQFIAYMAGLRRRTRGTASTSSTHTSVALLGSPASIASSAFYPSSSVASPPLAVDFPPTPFFKDEIPEELARKVASSFRQIPITTTPASTTNTSTDINTTSTSTLNTTSSDPPPRCLEPTSYVHKARHGFWNRRGDHLTPAGYIVYAPPHLAYPPDLQMYPQEDEGYMDDNGIYAKWSIIPELLSVYDYRHGHIFNLQYLTPMVV